MSTDLLLRMISLLEQCAPSMTEAQAAAFRALKPEFRDALERGRYLSPRFATTPEGVFIVHKNWYEGNPRSGAHLNACLGLGKEAHDLCEIRALIHVTFEPAHPLAMGITQAVNAIEDAVAQSEDSAPR